MFERNLWNNIFLSFLSFFVIYPSSVSAAVSNPMYRNIGTGFTDVVPRQIVRASDDHVYMFVSQVNQSVIVARWFTDSGIPTTTTAINSSQVNTSGGRPISVDTAYNGGSIIYVLANITNGTIVVYPFDLTSHSFLGSSILVSDSGKSQTDIGTSGISGMVDSSGILHLAYWSSQNTVIYTSYSYLGSKNTFNQTSSPLRLDSTGNANHPSLAVSPFDNSVTVAWVNGSNGDGSLYVRTKQPTGSFNAAQKINTSALWTSPNSGLNIDQGPTIVITQSNIKHIAYIENYVGSTDYGRTHHVYSNGSGWTDESLAFFTHDPAIVTDGTNIFIIGHGHPLDQGCTSMLDMCYISHAGNSWSSPVLFAPHPSNDSFDSSVSVKWSAVGFNRPQTIEFLFFSSGGNYTNTNTYYGQFTTDGVISTPLPTVTPIKKQGDANGDSSVNGADFVIWLNHYGQNVYGGTVGDFNNSGKVDGADFVLWLTNYGK